MGKFDGILICTDLDGTLLNQHFEVSKENHDAIEYFKSEGGKLTFITGRLHYYIRDIYHKVEPNAPVGCVNGGAVYDFDLGKYVYQTALDPSYKELISMMLEKMPEMGILVNTYEQVYYCQENSYTPCFRKATHLPENPKDYREISEAVAKVAFGSYHPEELDRAEALLRAHPLAEKFELVRTVPRLMELLPKGIHKGCAIPVLADYLGIDRKKTLAVGDYDSDIGMIQTAQVGVAMGNAVPKVKAVADYITVDNNHHAIARIISDIESGKIAL